MLPPSSPATKKFLVCMKREKKRGGKKNLFLPAPYSRERVSGQAVYWQLTVAVCIELPKVPDEPVGETVQYEAIG